MIDRSGWQYSGKPIPYKRLPPLMFRTVYYLIFGYTLLTVYPVPAQSQTGLEEGIPYSTYYSPKDYQANSQNWAVLQKQNGVMLFGNGDGVLTFDGSRWQLIPMTNNNLVRSIAFAADEKLYLGGYNDIGYIAEKAQGRSHIVSLVNKLSPDQREFGHVSNIIVAGREVYFSTDKNILVLKDNEIRTIEIPFENKRAFTSHHHNEIFVQPAMEGIFKIDGEKLLSLPGGEFYKGKRITAILPYESDVSLICTLESGLYLYDGKKSKPFASDVDEFIKENRLYKAIRLNNGNYALATLLHGVAIINRQGSLVQLLAKGRGLGDNAAYNLLEDRQGALWVTMSVGVSRVELQAPMTWFDEKNGLEGSVTDITRFENELYAGTMMGLYKLVRGSAFTVQPHFEKVNEISSSVWAMAVRHGSLIAATDHGTVESRGGRFRFLDEYSGAVMLPSYYDPNVIYVGLTDGIVILQFENGKWRSAGKVPGVEADVGEMNEDVHGNLWLGTFSEGVVQVRFPAAAASRDYFHPEISHFNAKHGLPLGYVQINRIDDELVFRVEPRRTLYRFSLAKTVFEKATLKDKFPGYDSTTMFPFTNEQGGVVWMVNSKKPKPAFDFLIYNKSPAGFNQEHISFSRVREDVDEAIFIDPDNAVWLGGLDGIVRFRYKSYLERNLSFNVILNEIKLSNDSVLYAGYTSPTDNATFSYDHNTIDFSFGATSYDLQQENEFQYMLEGFDDGWSTWAKDRVKSYTRIFEGKYVFKVRGRNIFGDVSRETKYSFTIAAPWYRHILAYIGYGILLGGTMYGVVRIRSQKLVREKVALEQIIQDRTVEVSNKNRQLEQQAEELKSQTEQLKEMDKIKSNFFANISHEFRTPLSLILAPLERELLDTPHKPEAEMMYRNARKLQHLINQLLDLSKLESGQMKVFLCKNDLTSFIKNIVSSFNPLAHSKNISFEISIPSTSTEAYFDADKVETILNNLLSHAFKFTPDGGAVSFNMEVLENQKICALKIKDTGVGIPEKELSKVFNRFYQVDGGVQREFEGSGIGLALTKELVILMQGDISVTSTIGHGAEFVVTLPLSQGANTTIPEEITFQYTPTPEVSTETLYATADTAHREQHTILLVEDNKDLNAYLSNVLEKSYRIISAFNGEEALAAARDEVPNLILSDMMMPKMDGFTLCEAIRKDETTSHIPFILLTARSSVESRLAGLELGADDYMTKPFNIAELQIRIKNLLRQRENLKKRFGKELKIAPKDITVTSIDERFLLKVISVLEINLANSAFSVEMLSDEIGMSRKNLHRKLVALVDQSPNEFIRVFRLKAAMQLLEQESGIVKEIAFAVGFNNLSYFAKCFKEQFGISPTEVKVKKDLAD